MSNSKLIAALIGGSVAGVVIGLLMAPESGKSTRKKLVKLTNRGRELLNQQQEGNMQKKEQMKDYVENGVEYGADEWDDLVAHLLQRGKKWWSQTKHDADEWDDLVAHILQSGKDWWGKTKYEAEQRATESAHPVEHTSGNGVEVQSK